MVVAARLRWLKQQVLKGVDMVLHVGVAKDTAKCKLRCVLYPKRPPLQPASQRVLTATLDTIAAVVELCVTVDRGHAHSNGTSSEVAFWISGPFGSPGQATEDGNDKDDEAAERGSQEQTGKAHHDGKETEKKEEEAEGEEEEESNETSQSGTAEEEEEETEHEENERENLTDGDNEEKDIAEVHKKVEEMEVSQRSDESCGSSSSSRSSATGNTQTWHEGFTHVIGKLEEAILDLQRQREAATRLVVDMERIFELEENAEDLQVARQSMGALAFGLEQLAYLRTKVMAARTDLATTEIAESDEESAT